MLYLSLTHLMSVWRTPENLLSLTVTLQSSLLLMGFQLCEPEAYPATNTALHYYNG